MSPVGGKRGERAAANERPIVVDASFVLDALTHTDGFAVAGGYDLSAPPLLWSEVRSALHEAAWRGTIPRALADDAHRRLSAVPVRRRAPAALGMTAWAIAEQMGVAKTHDAEYLALARLVGGRVVTTDGRLRRGAARLGLVIGPTEL